MDNIIKLRLTACVLPFILCLLITPLPSVTLTIKNQVDSPLLTRIRSKISLTQEKLAYCGTERVRPKRDLICAQFCTDGECKLFYCSCPDPPTQERNCSSVNEGKCEGHCRKANMVTAHLCPGLAEISESESDFDIRSGSRLDNAKKYCVCS